MISAAGLEVESQHRVAGVTSHSSHGTVRRADDETMVKNFFSKVKGQSTSPAIFWIFLIDIDYYRETNLNLLAGHLELQISLCIWKYVTSSQYKVYVLARMGNTTAHTPAMMVYPTSKPGSYKTAPQAPSLHPPSSLLCLMYKVHWLTIYYNT